MSALQSDSTAPQLPYFIRPLARTIDAIDLGYLQARGAFLLPDQPLLAELLQTFFDFIYPFAPIVDKEDIHKLFECQASTREGENTKLSLFLVQAIAFVSSAVSLL